MLVLVVLTVVALGSGRARHSQLVNFVPLRLESNQPPQIYLAGPFTLVPSSVILGWETEEIKPEKIVRLVNEERGRVGLPFLVQNPKLAEAAGMRVATIFKNQNFSHKDSVDRIQLSTVLPRVNYYFSYASENIGMAQDSAAGIVQGFMSSLPHRQNLLDPRLVETGVAVRKDRFKGNYVVIVVQLFGIPASKEAYFGYSEVDKATVKGLIDGVSTELGQTESFLVSNPGSQYYKGWREVLVEQRQRLSEVYRRMLEGLPFERREYDLVAAYDNGWKGAPR